jgi:hypothetical protein
MVFNVGNFWRLPLPFLTQWNEDIHAVLILGKDVPGGRHGGIQGSGGTVPRINFSTRWMWQVSFTPRPLYRLHMVLWYPLKRRFGGPPGPVWTLWTEKTYPTGNRSVILSLPARNLVIKSPTPPRVSNYELGRSTRIQDPLLVQSPRILHTCRFE